MLLLPLLGACFAGFFGRYFHDKVSHYATSIAMAVAAILSWIIFVSFLQGETPYYAPLFTWVDVGGLVFEWGLRVDALSANMLIVITTVSCLVHFYSIGYMADDPHNPRFMAYLSLFTFMMLMLVTADNLIQLFFGWEGVGLASYLLIGFWYKKPSACSAAIKAFVVNRVGDVGFALGIFAVFLLTGSVQFDEIFNQIGQYKNDEIVFLGFEVHTITLIAILLFIGAMGKSAQLGLHTWLPDAMEGPTPVSALIHAATMVTAGVFMMTRLSPLVEYSDTALAFITIIGALTAFFAASIGLTQRDIKRVIAYSTCSQLGYMFFAIGVSAYPAAMFHLTTHAFFKALLFLGAGSVIHAMHHEQDMFKMGGIYRFVPITYIMMWIGSLALAGVPFFAGYYSKDMILESAFASNNMVGNIAFVLGILAALMTAFYSWRLLFLTFHGQARASQEVMKHVHESPKIMVVPLLILSIGAVFSGMVFYDYFVGDSMKNFWQQAIVILPYHQALENAHHVPLWVKILPIMVGLLGIMIAYLFYIKKPDMPHIIATKCRPLYMLSYNKWYVDELYHVIFTKTSFVLGAFFWNRGDKKTIDALGPNGLSLSSLKLGTIAGKAQSGYVYHYVIVMIIGVCALIALTYVFV